MGASRRGWRPVSPPGTVFRPFWVFLQPDGSVFGTEGDVAQVPGDSPVLQQPGFDDDHVLVASSEGLFSVKIGSSDVEQLAKASGTPSAPVPSR